MGVLDGLETTLKNCRLYYRWQCKKEADAPVVLLLHGWGCDSSIFSFIENGLSEDASVLSVDFPGHGKSGDPPESWGVQDYAEQILLLLDELSLPKVDVVAHSFGGRVALWLASHQPERVDRLVITGGAGIRKPISEGQKKRQARFKRLNRCCGWLKKIPFLRGWVERLEDQLRRKYGSPDYYKLNEVMRGTFVKVVNEDLLPLLPAITAPTLLIWGSDDTETPLWMGQQMEKQIPDAALIVFEGRTHFAFLEEWQRFLIIIKEFFLGGKQ